MIKVETKPLFTNNNNNKYYKKSYSLTIDGGRINDIPRMNYWHYESRGRLLCKKTYREILDYLITQRLTVKTPKNQWDEWNGAISLPHKAGLTRGRDSDYE